MRKKIFVATLLLTALLLLAFSTGWCIEAPGNVFYVSEGKLYSTQPDGRGEKVVAQPVDAEQPLLSPKSTHIAFIYGPGIFIKDLSNSEQPIKIYSGKEGQKPNLYRWFPDNKIVFRVPLKDGIYTYYKIDKNGENLAQLGEFYESPSISPTGKYWIHSDYSPDKKKSEVYGGELSAENQRYVYSGKVENSLSWDPETETVLYSLNDKIYGANMETRERQIINLPFKEVTIVSFAGSTVLYYHPDTQKNEPGLKMFDPESNDQKTVIEDKKAFRYVTSNPAEDRVVVFVPAKPTDMMGEGDLYLVDLKKGEAEKLTRDVGSRIFAQVDTGRQWSPDGLYFLYEKLGLKRGKITKSEFYVAGKEKPDKLYKKDKKKKGSKDMRSFKESAVPLWGEDTK